MGWGWITEPAGDFWNAVKEHAIDPLWPPDDEQDAWDLAKEWSSVAKLMDETATALEAQARVSETVWVDDAGAEFTHALRNLPETFRVMADGMRSLSAGMDDYGNAIREAKIGVVIEIAANALIWGALMGMGPLGGIFANTLARVVAGRLTSFISSLIGRGVSGGLTRALEIGVGAGIEIGTEALDEALINTATQLTSMAMGSRDNFDYGQLGEAALAGGIGGILGKGVGKVTAPITRATGAGLNRVMPDGVARNINAGIGSALNNSITSPVSGYIARNIDNLDALTDVDGYTNEIKQNGIASGLMGAPRSMVVDSVQQIHSNGQQVADDWVNRVSGNTPEMRGGAPTGDPASGSAGGGTPGGGTGGGTQGGGEAGGTGSGAQTGAGTQAGGAQTGGETGGTQGAQTGGQAGAQTGGEAGGTQGAQTGGEAGGTQTGNGQAGGTQTAGTQTGGETGGTQTGGAQTGGEAGGAQTGGPAGGQAGGEAGGTQSGATQSGAPAGGTQTGGPQAGTGEAQTGGTQTGSGPAAGTQSSTGGAQTGGSQTSGSPAAGEASSTQTSGTKTSGVQPGAEANGTQSSGAKTSGIQPGSEASNTQTSGEANSTQASGETGNTQTSGEANTTQASGEAGNTQTGTGGTESGGTQTGGPQSGVGGTEGSTQSGGTQQGGAQSTGPGQAGTGVTQSGAGVQAVGVAPVGAAPAPTASATPTHTSSVGQPAGSSRQSGNEANTQTTPNAGQSSSTQTTGTGQSSGTQATSTGQSSSTQITGTGQSSGTQATSTSTGTQTTGTGPSSGTQATGTSTGQSSSTQTTSTGQSSGTQGAPAAGKPGAGVSGTQAATSQSGSDPGSSARPSTTGTPAAGAAAVASRAVAAASPSPANEPGSAAPRPTRVKVGRPPGSGPSGRGAGGNNGGSGTTGGTPASSPGGDPEITVGKIKSVTRQALDRARDAAQAAQDALAAAKAAEDAVRRSLAEGTQEAADEAFAAAQQSALMKVNAENVAYLAEEAANTAEQTAEKAASQPGGRVSEKRVQNARDAATKANEAAVKALEAAIAAWRAATVDGTPPPPRGDRPMRGDPDRQPDDAAVPLQPEVHVLGTYSPDRLTVVDGVITEIDGQPVAQKVRELARHRAELYYLGKLAQEPAGADTGNAIAVVLNVRTGVVLEATNGQARTAIPEVSRDPKRTVAAKPLHEKLEELERQLRIPAHYPQWNNDGTPAPGPRTDLPGTPNEPLFRHAEVRAANEHLHASNDVELTDLLADVWNTGETGPALTPFCPNCTGVLPGVRNLSGRQEYSEQGNVQRINTVPPELPDGPTATSTPPATSSAGGPTATSPTSSGQSPNAQTSSQQTAPSSQSPASQPTPPIGQNPSAPNQTTSTNTQTPPTGQNPANPPTQTTASAGNTQTPPTGSKATGSQAPNAQTGTGSANQSSVSQSGNQSSATQSGLPGGPNPSPPPGPTPTQPNPIPSPPSPTPTQPNPIPSPPSPTPTQPNPIPSPPPPVPGGLPVGAWSRVDLVRHSRFAATRVAHHTARTVLKRAYAAMKNRSVWTDASVREIKYHEASDSFEVIRADGTSFIAHVVTGKVDQRGHAEVMITDDQTNRVEIRVSTRVRLNTIERVVANAVAQADAILRPDARTTDDALRHDTHPGDNTALSVADHGREAEVRHLDRAKNEARVLRRRRIASEMRSLVEDLGMHPDDDVAPQRNAVSTVAGVIENHTTRGERRPAWVMPPTGYPTWKAFFFLHLPAELLPGTAAGIAILGTGAPPAIAWATWTATAVTGVTGTIAKRWYGLQEKTRVDTGHGVNIKQRAHERANRRRKLADEILEHTIAAGLDSNPKDEPVLQEELPAEPLGLRARIVHRSLPVVLGSAAGASLGFFGLPIWNVIAYAIIGTITGLAGPKAEKYIRKAMVPMEWAKLANAGRKGDVREAELDEQAAAVLIEFLTRLRNIAAARSNTTGPPSVKVDPEKVIEPGYRHFIADGSVGQTGDSARGGMDAVGMAVDGNEALRAVLEKAGTGGMRSVLGAVVGMLIDQKATQREYNMIVEQVVFDFGNKTAEQMEQEFQLLVEFVNAIGPLITTAETDAGLVNTTPNTQLSQDLLPEVVDDPDRRPVGRQGFKAFIVKHLAQGGAMMGIMAGATELLNQPSAGLIVIGAVSGTIVASFPLRWAFRRAEQNAVDKTVLRDRDQERPVERAETAAMRDILIKFGTNELQAAVNGQTTRNATPHVTEPSDPADPAGIDQFVTEERTLLANDPRPVKTFGARAATLVRLSRLAQRVRVFEAHARNTGNDKPLEQAREDLATLYQAYQDLKNLKDPNDPDDPAIEVPPDHEALLNDAAERQQQEKPPGFRGGEPGTTPAEDLRSYLNRRTRTPAGRAFYTADEMPSTAKAVPRVPGMYTVDMHGDPDSVRIGSRYLTADDLANLLEADPHWKGEPIRLLACETGQSANGFAQQLADRLGVTVYAPSDYVFVSARGSVYVTGWERRNGIVVPKMPPTGKVYAFDPAVPRAHGTPAVEPASNPAPVPPRVRVWWPEEDEIDFGEVPEVDLPEELGELTLMRHGPTVYTGSDRLWPDELADIVAEHGDWAGGPTRLQVRDGQVDPEFVQRLADLLGVPVVVPASAVTGDFPTLSSGTLEVYNEPSPEPTPPGCRVYEPRNVTAGKGTS